MYAGSSLLACFLEVLAGFRRDARLAVELDDIVEDAEDSVLHPPQHQGRFRGNGWMPEPQPQPNWQGTTAPRRTPNPSQSCIRTLSARHGTALGLGLADLGAAALKNPRPRELTQAIATWIYETTDLHGVTFASPPRRRPAAMGGLRRPDDGFLSLQLRNIETEELHHESDPH